jgi:catechol 2,3-dioxygenase-like lactoylglutathione lyase family enzyme
MILAPIYQMAFVVADLDAAIAQWVGLRGAGPFYRFDDFAFDNAVCAAGLAPPAISIALGQSGPVNIELIAVLPGPATLFTMPPGLHHVARRSADVDRTLAGLADAGAPTLLRATFGADVAVGFSDTRATLGCMTELIADDPGVDAMLAQIVADANVWDGRHPVRRF